MNLIEKAANFAMEFTKWLLGGGKYRPDNEIDRLFKICQSNRCEQYIEIDETKGQCGICGCYLKTSKDKNFNKLAMSTTSCPRQPPLWTAEETSKSTPAKKKGGCPCARKNR